jgi:hypothetical protein
MRFVGKQLRRCSLSQCERTAEFLSSTHRLYCKMHAMLLMAGGQILKEENELREQMLENEREAGPIGEQLDFDEWWEKLYGPGKEIKK